MQIVELSKIMKIFGIGDATTVALDAVDFRVSQGEFVAIMGPSGSGKTTLLNIIGLLDSADSGEYRLENKLVNNLNRSQKVKYRRDHIGFVFQSFNLVPNMNVITNVAMPLAYSGVRYLKRLRLASDMCERLDLRQKEYYLPNQLSGGQRQKAAIARALINNPSLVVADEPTGNLDSDSSRTIMELLKELNDRGNTVIMVTHNPELTAYASRIVYMRDGRIEYDQKLGRNEAADIGQIQAKLLASKPNRPKPKTKKNKRKKPSSRKVRK